MPLYTGNCDYIIVSIIIRKKKKRFNRKLDQRVRDKGEEKKKVKLLRNNRLGSIDNVTSRQHSNE